MPVPHYQTVMHPLLRFLSDGRERSLGEAIEAISGEFHLTAEERQQLLPGGTSTVIGSRVGWARTYMKKALTRLHEAWIHSYYRAWHGGQSIRIRTLSLQAFAEQ